MTEHVAAFLGGSILSYLGRTMELELEAGSFDGHDSSVTYVVSGRAGTRVRVTVSIESADDLDR